MKKKNNKNKVGLVFCHVSMVASFQDFISRYPSSLLKPLRSPTILVRRPEGLVTSHCNLNLAVLIISFFKRNWLNWCRSFYISATMFFDSTFHTSTCVFRICRGLRRVLCLQFGYLVFVVSILLGCVLSHMSSLLDYLFHSWDTIQMSTSSRMRLYSFFSTDGYFYICFRVHLFFSNAIFTCRLSVFYILYPGLSLLVVEGRWSPNSSFFDDDGLMKHGVIVTYVFCLCCFYKNENLGLSSWRTPK